MAFPMRLMSYPVRGQPPGLSAPAAGAQRQAGGCLRSTGDPHAAHAVTEAVDPEAGHVILLDLHGVALVVGALKQADLVLLGVLGRTGGVMRRKVA